MRAFCAAMGSSFRLETMSIAEGALGRIDEATRCGGAGAGCGAVPTLRGRPTRRGSLVGAGGGAATITGAGGADGAGAMTAGAGGAGGLKTVAGAGGVATTGAGGADGVGGAKTTSRTGGGAGGLPDLRVR